MLSDDKRRRCLIQQRAMRALRVVVSPIVSDQDFSFRESREHFAVKQLITKARVKRFRIGVLPRAARFNVERGDSRLLKPFFNRMGDELRPVVRAEKARRTALCEQTVQHANNILCGQVTGDFDLQAFARELIHDRQHFQAASVGGLIHHEVVAPDLIRVRRRAPHNAIVRTAKPPSLALCPRYFQAFRSPEAMNSFPIHAPAVPVQQRRYPAVAVARMPLAQFVQPLAESRLEAALFLRVALR